MSESTNSPAAVAAPGKYLTFFLGNEEYGLPILAVREIIGMQPITRVPKASPFIRGVINLRGKVIAIADLRTAFSMPSIEDPQVIVVVNIANAAVGLVVDRVSEVTLVGESDIEAPPMFGIGLNADFLSGIAKREGRVRLLLNIERVFAAQQVTELVAARTASA